MSIYLISSHLRTDNTDFPFVVICFEIDKNGAAVPASVAEGTDELDCIEAVLFWSEQQPNATVFAKTVKEDPDAVPCGNHYRRKLPDNDDLLEQIHTVRMEIALNTINQIFHELVEKIEKQIAEDEAAEKPKH